MIQLESVSKSYGTTRVVDEVTLDVPSGELLVLVGRSGSGKTTLLKMINRLVPFCRGRILIDGQSIDERDPIQLRRQVGYVFQESALFPHLSVSDNIGLVPALLKWPEAQIRDRVRELLQLVGLRPSHFSNRRPSQLSAGQKQRVALARALAARPQVLLMDEPFGALDPVTRASLQLEFRQLQRELGTTTILVTHDVTEAFLLADRIAVMDHARLVQVGVPQQVISRPADESVRSLLETPFGQLQALRPLWTLIQGLETGDGEPC